MTIWVWVCVAVCVAVRCSVLQVLSLKLNEEVWVWVCCSVLQYVAVCCKH